LRGIKTEQCVGEKLGEYRRGKKGGVEVKKQKKISKRKAGCWESTSGRVGTQTAFSADRPLRRSKGRNGEKKRREEFT